MEGIMFGWIDGWMDGSMIGLVMYCNCIMDEIHGFLD